MDNVVQVQPKGLLTIPVSIRQQYGISGGSFVRLRPLRGGVMVEPVRVLPYPVRSYTNQDLKEFFAFDDELTQKMGKNRSA